MSQLFIVVIGKEQPAGAKKSLPEREMKSFRDSRSIYELVVEIGHKSDDPRYVDNIFSVDHNGNVTFHELAIERGRIVMKPIPNVTCCDR
jgi:hypothetical protein